MTHNRRLLWVLPLLGMTAWPALPASGQMDALSDPEFIEGLRERGMTDLLVHLADSGELDDPAAAHLITIAQQRLEAFNPDRSLEQQQQALADAIERYRQLLGDASLADRPERPMWLTDFAEVLLFDYLTRQQRNALEFYTLGVPTAEQRTAYEAVAAEALASAEQANLALFRLQSRLSQDPGLRDRLSAAGTLDRLTELYGEQKTPYWLGLASLYTAQLPDEADYFAQIAAGTRNPGVPPQEPTVERERERLLGQAADRLIEFAEDTSQPEVVQKQSAVAVGRARTLAGDPDAAAGGPLGEVVAAGGGGYADLLAQIAMAYVREAGGEPERAMAILEQAQNHGAVQEDTTRLLHTLVVDAMHRLLQQRAAQASGEQAQQLRSASYEVYLDFLDNPQIDGQTAERLRSYIYQRWEASVPEDRDPAELPPAVRLGVATVALGRAQQGQGDPTELRAKAIRYLETLIGDEVSPEVRAPATFNLMAALFATDRTGPTVLQIAQLGTNLAETLPERRESERAIEIAISLMRQAHQQAAADPRVAQQYQRTARVLLDQFGRTAAADRERLYYVLEVLEPQGELEQAVAALEPIPMTHPDYFGARQQMVVYLQRLRERATQRLAALEGSEAPAAERAEAAAQRDQYTQQLREAAEQLISDARNELLDREGVESARLVAASRSLGAARIALADLAIAQDQYDLAMELLEPFEREHADEPVLMNQARSRRILVQMESGDLEALRQTASTLFEADPDAAAPVVFEVLTRLDQQIQSLRGQAAEQALPARREQLEQEAQTKAQAAVQLSELLLQWAQGQGFPADQMLGYQLMRARALNIADRPGEALELVRPLASQFPNEVQVIHNLAEAMFKQAEQAGGAEAQRLYIEAVPLFDQIIQGLDAQNPKPDPWWNAWTRRLQVLSRIGSPEQQSNIGRLVNRIEREQGSLGPQQYARTLRDLRTRHGG